VTIVFDAEGDGEACDCVAESFRLLDWIKDWCYNKSNVGEYTRPISINDLGCPGCNTKIGEEIEFNNDGFMEFQCNNCLRFLDISDLGE
jgi:hypothetical protein